MPASAIPSPAACAPARPSTPRWCGAAGAAGRRDVGARRLRRGRRSISSTACGTIAATVAGIAADPAGGAAPVVRVPLGEFATASRALDFGAEGVIAPMINTVGRRARLRRATKYPAARRAQLGAAPRHDARRHRRSERLSARGQRHDRHARDDRDPRRRWTTSTRSRRRPASTACSSGRPICRSR